MGFLQTVSKVFSPIVSVAKSFNQEVGIRGAEPRKGNFAWMAGLPSKKVLKPIVINSHTLKQLSNTDPITWSIKACRKAQVTGTEWDIVRDTEELELELDRWYNNIMNNLNPWGFEEIFHPIVISQELFMKASMDIKSILAAPITPKVAPVQPVVQPTQPAIGQPPVAKADGNEVRDGLNAVHQALAAAKQVTQGASPSQPVEQPTQPTQPTQANQPVQPNQPAVVPVVNLAAEKEERKKQLKWYFESLKRKVQQDADGHALVVKRIFERPNGDETRTFRTFIEILLDDILTFDAGVIVKNKNYMGELAELYIIPGQDVKIYRNPDRTVPDEPEPAYCWEDQGVLRAEYTKNEIVYMMANPQQNGYGQSPLEVAAYIITASLYADEYNMDFFKHSNVPPAIFNLGKNVTQEQRRAFETHWENEVQGKGLHRMQFLAGADSPQYIPMQNQSSREMQMMEYLKWTLSIKCACYQISPQDVGFVQDFHRTTAQVQKQLTKERGIKNLLSLIETYFNTEIVKKEFPFHDVKFQWQGVDLMDDQVQMTIDIADITAGVISRNDRRKKLGLPAVDGGDVILVNVGSQLIPIEDLVPPEETIEQQTAQAMQPVTADVNGNVSPQQATVNSVDTSVADRNKIVRMTTTHEDKIAKAMDVLKVQGLGDNEIKITLED